MRPMMRQRSSPKWHGNVTIFFRGRHLFVTPVCNGEHETPTQPNERPTKIMKHRQLLIDLVKRVSAVATAAAIFVAPAGGAFANPPNHERQRSEHAVQRLRHIIVIYQENWSFDSLYGQFPGANG